MVDNWNIIISKSDSDIRTRKSPDFNADLIPVNFYIGVPIETIHFLSSRPTFRGEFAIPATYGN